MKKIIFAFLAALQIASVPETRETVPDMLVVTEAVHKEDFSGYFVAVPLREIMYKNEGKHFYDTKYMINEDPEDLETGDYIAVILKGKKVIDYRYIGTRF